MSVPDIGMLPGLSAYFGVSIDELFALSDEIRIERIQNMIWDVHFLNPADVENERQFLLEKAHPDDSFMAVHKIKLAIAMGDLAAAKAMWTALDSKYPDDWSIQHWIGDLMTLAGEYAGAKEHYKKVIALLPVPRYVDPIDSLAQACEMDGDIEGAIAARKLELEVSEKDWDSTTGETIDHIHREIARLERML